MNYNNVLILAPHTDDGELGCGGTIAKLLEDGSNVYYVAFSTAEESLPVGMKKDTLKLEVQEATKVIGIKRENLFIFNYEVRKLNYVRQEILEKLIELKRKIKFDLVFMPSLHDIHQDHSTIATEGVRAFKTTRILGYELIWNNLSFDTTSFSILEERHIRKKIDALQAYKSQEGRTYMDEKFINAFPVDSSGWMFKSKSKS